MNQHLRDHWKKRLQSSGLDPQAAHEVAYAASYVDAIRLARDSVGNQEEARLVVITCTGPVGTWDKLLESEI